jgi:hypothetical protein
MSDTDKWRKAGHYYELGSIKVQGVQNTETGEYKTVILNSWDDDVRLGEKIARDEFRDEE